MLFELCALKLVISLSPALAVPTGAGGWWESTELTVRRLDEEVELSGCG